MGTVTQIEELRREIVGRLPDAAVTIDSPHAADGTWWVDVERDGRIASVEWRPGRGYGIAGPGGGYGEGPDYVVVDTAEAAEEVVRLLERSTDWRRTEELEEQIQVVLRSIQAAKQHYEEVMRWMAAQMGIQLPPALREEMTQVSDEVRRAELDLLAMTESLTRHHSSSHSATDDAEN